uniref:Uncharacterized protein n=1 Tax=Leersia perrieri TaxID=77586 RepID=A0A0D9VVC7_9ORYZ
MAGSRPSPLDPALRSVAAWLPAREERRREEEAGTGRWRGGMEIGERGGIGGRRRQAERKMEGRDGDWRERRDRRAEDYGRPYLWRWAINWRRVRSITSRERATLGEAHKLLHEDIHGAKTVAAYALAVVPALNVRDREDTAAAARLVASVFSEKPVLPGAIDAAMDLVFSILHSDVLAALVRAEAPIPAATVGAATKLFAHVSSGVEPADGAGHEIRQ